MVWSATADHTCSPPDFFIHAEAKILILYYIKQGGVSYIDCLQGKNMKQNSLVFFEEKDLISPENFSAKEKSILDSINLKVAGGRMGQAVEKAFIIEQLSTAMSSYMEMLSFVSHELKNPLSSIIMTAKTLSSGYFGEIGGKQKNAADHIVKKAEFLLNLTGEGSILVSVWNRGPGFPESEKMNLFKRFSILQTPELAERKGHGVGLYVTWKIIQLHGGRIWADSVHGEWAEFFFEIPVMMDQCLLQ